MNTALTRIRKTEEGSSLLLVTILIVIAFMLLGSALSWSSHNAVTIARNSQYWRTVAAAEAATEKVLSRLAWDFQSVNGENTVYGALNAGTYRSLVPTAGEDSYWTPYAFSDGLGNNSQTYVALVPASRTNWTALNSQYAGLFGVTDSYMVISYSRDTQGRFNVSAGVQQNVQLATIPLFQFAIFYNVYLQVEPGPNMTVTGRVHGNRNIYQNPGANLTYQSHVTSAGNIINGPVPGDPSHSGIDNGTVTYNGEHDSKTAQLTLPISSGSDPNTVYEIVKPPPAGGDSDATMGKERYYNKADIIIRVTDPPAGSPPGTPPVVIGTSGSYNLLATPVNVGGFVTVSTNKFYNGREGKGVNAIDINVGAFKAWADNPAGGASSLWTLYGHEPGLLYVLDQRTASIPSGTEPGVRVLNGAQLPNGGLTVATADPIYVQGDFNTRDSSGVSVGSDTTHTKPASLVGDAITVLSNGWTDSANATSSKGNLHDASSTTVNAAILAGIVQTTSGSYSGGVENFPRFLENWSGDTLTYNGSMVVMFYSRIATGLWRGTGTYYNPPTRNWTFDNNFLNPNKQPPGTPAFRVLIRGDWLTLGRDPTAG